MLRDNGCLPDDDFLGESASPSEISRPAPAHARPLLAAARRWEAGSAGNGWGKLQVNKIKSVSVVPFLKRPLIPGFPLLYNLVLRSEVSVPLRCSCDRTRRLLILRELSVGTVATLFLPSYG